MEGDSCAMCGSTDVEIAGHSWSEVVCNECGYVGEPDRSDAEAEA